MANAWVVTAAGDAAPDAWRRLVAHMIRSYATPGAPMQAMPDVPSAAALYRATVRLSPTVCPWSRSGLRLPASERGAPTCPLNLRCEEPPVTGLR